MRYIISWFWCFCNLATLSSLASNVRDTNTTLTTSDTKDVPKIIAYADNRVEKLKQSLEAAGFSVQLRQNMIQVLSIPAGWHAERQQSLKVMKDQATNRYFDNLHRLRFKVHYLNHLYYEKCWGSMYCYETDSFSESPSE